MEIGLSLIVALLFGVCLLLLLNSISRRKKQDSSLLDAEDLSPEQLSTQLTDDSWEGSFSEAENPKALSVNLQIRYVDGAGLESDRKIRVLEFDNDLHDGIMIAHCYMREAIRTFRFNRIQSCLNSDTQEPVVDVAAYLNEQYEQSAVSSQT